MKASVYFANLKKAVTGQSIAGGKYAIDVNIAGSGGSPVPPAVLGPVVNIAAGNMAGNITGPSIDITGYEGLSFALSWNGNPTGTFSIEVSNDNAIFIPLTLSAPATAVGAAGTGFIDIDGTKAGYIRLVYTAAGGAGLLDVTVVGKSN